MFHHVYVFILTLCILLLSVNFVWRAIHSTPHEFDSITYHIPLAKSILNGSITQPNKLLFPNSAFPAVTEIILAFMMLLHIPLNLFNCIGLFILWYAIFRFAKQLKLRKNAWLIGLVVVTLPTTVRLLHSQTADIWIAVFFVWVLTLLNKPKKSFFYFLQLGVSSGLLIGSKYSGPLFLLGLLLVYGGSLMRMSSFSRLVVFFIPFCIFGLSWYIRNMIIFHNPFFPAPFLFFKGMSAFAPNVFLSHYKMIIFVKNGLIHTINALISEYLHWIGILSIAVPIALRSQNSFLTRKDKQLLIVGGIGILIYLIIPGYAYNYNNYVSEIRYSIPVIIPFLIVFFSIQQKKGFTAHFFLFIFLNLVALFALFVFGRYHPKVISAVGILFYLLFIAPYPKRA